jgi:hypothetical protein
MFSSSRCLFKRSSQQKILREKATRKEGSKLKYDKGWGPMMNLMIISDSQISREEEGRTLSFNFTFTRILFTVERGDNLNN